MIGTERAIDNGERKDVKDTGDRSERLHAYCATWEYFLSFEGDGEAEFGGDGGRADQPRVSVMGTVTLLGNITAPPVGGE